MFKYLFLSIIFLLLIPHGALSDIIYLKSGYKIKGVVEKETDSAVTIALSIGAVTYPKEQIESVLKEVDEANAELKAKWDRQRQMPQIAEQQAEEFTEEQPKDEYKKIDETESKERQIIYVPDTRITVPLKPKKSIYDKLEDKIDYKSLLGKTTAMRLKDNPRQVYYLYLPERYSPEKKWPLFISIHAYKCNGKHAIDMWRWLSDKEGFILAAPTFLDGYQRLEYATDHRMIDIIKELRANLQIDDDKVFMAGFSGGAQFTHRFVLRHPEYVQAVSIMAAGSYDFPPDSSKTKEIKFLVMVGEKDTERFAISKKFAEQLKEKGYDVKFKSFPGIDHEFCEGFKNLTIDLFRGINAK